MYTLWKSSCDILDDATQLTGSLTREQFSTPDSSCFSGTIGGHIRHCLQHFESFRDGIASGTINYEARERGTLVETDPSAAVESLKSLSKWFSDQIDRHDKNEPVRVLVTMGDMSEEVESTVSRELQFLISHTVHHFAIIAIMCRSFGIEIDPEFGMAPSTLKHHQSLAAK